MTRIVFRSENWCFTRELPNIKYYTLYRATLVSVYATEHYACINNGNQPTDKRFDRWYIDGNLVRRWKRKWILLVTKSVTRLSQFETELRVSCETIEISDVVSNDIRSLGNLVYEIKKQQHNGDRKMIGNENFLWWGRRSFDYSNVNSDLVGIGL